MNPGDVAETDLVGNNDYCGEDLQPEPAGYGEFPARCISHLVGDESREPVQVNEPRRHHERDDRHQREGDDEKQESSSPPRHGCQS